MFADRIGLSSSAPPIQRFRTGSAAIPNVVAAAAAAVQPTASHRGAGSASIPSPGILTSGAHSARNPTTSHTMHVDVRSKLPLASAVTSSQTSNSSSSTSVPNVAASAGTVPRSHAEALQKGPILRRPEKGSAHSTPSPSIPPASIDPAPGSNRPRSGSQAQSSTAVAPGSSRTAVAPYTANKESTLPSSGETVQPPNLTPPVLMPARAAPNAPVYTYFMPFGTANSPPVFYQVTQVQLDSQFNIAWEEVKKKASGLQDELQKAILQNLQIVYKHICQTGLRQDDKYHFFIQSGIPGPPVPSTVPAVNQAPTNTKPRPASDLMTGGPAREGPSLHQQPLMKPARDQAVQQRMDQTASKASPADAQMTSNLASSALNLLPPPASLSPSERAVPPPESLSAPPQAGPSTPHRAMSFVEILRQNNPSAQDLADSIIRDLGSPRKNTRKRKFAPEGDVEAGPSSPEKGRRKSRLDSSPAQARENSLNGPQKDGTDSMGDKSAAMVTALGSKPCPPAPKPAPVQQAFLFNPYLPTVPTPSAKTSPGDVSVPIRVPVPLPTKPSADSDTSVHQTTTNPNAPTDVPASRSSLALRDTSQISTSPDSPQETSQQPPQMNPLAPHPPVQPTIPADQPLPSPQPPPTNTLNIIPPTPTQPPTAAKQPNLERLIPPPIYSILPSPNRPTPPPAIAVLPASDDIHFSPSPDPASRGVDSEVDELMDDADENPTVVDAVAPVSAPTIPADAPPATNDTAANVAETTTMLPRVRVRPRTEFWVEIPYRPDLLKKARKGPASGPKPKARSGISGSRTTSRSASSSAEGRGSRTPSQAGGQLNDVLSDYHARQIIVPCRWKGCKVKVDSLEKLRLHINITHIPKDEQRSFDCQWRGCPAKPFETRKSLREHVKGHISKLYPCPLENCAALLDSETSLLKHVHNTHRSTGHLCTIALPTQLVPPAELPTIPTGPIPVYHEYKGLVRPAVISQAKREKLSPEVLRGLLGRGMTQGLPRNVLLRRLMQESLTLETASAFDEYEFLRKDDDKDLRSMPDLVGLRALKEEMRPTIGISLAGHWHPSGPHSVAGSKPPSRASGQRSPLLPLNKLEAQDGAETTVPGRSRRSSTQSNKKGSVLDPIVLDDLDD
ncbi:GLI zinc finger 1 [Tulasnella sp. UAMH 9824]|nr:GLI zinc finger 1 [Tulasnella sp. UAMH 9824]